ncbi:hypothetical protein MASR1M32_39820 [Rhodobacter sp.]
MAVDKTDLLGLAHHMGIGDGDHGLFPQRKAEPRKRSPSSLLRTVRTVSMAASSVTAAASAKAGRPAGSASVSISVRPKIAATISLRHRPLPVAFRVSVFENISFQLPDSLRASGHPDGKCPRPCLMCRNVGRKTVKVT